MSMSTSPSPSPGVYDFDSPSPKWRFNPWTFSTLLVAVIVALPILGIPWLALTPEENIWPHLASTVLPSYVTTTLLLMLGVTFGVFTMGVTSAWLVTMCRFPGRRIFEWAQLLPMAVPAYVIAYVYTDLLEYAGPVQIGLRHVFGWESAADYWFPEIRSLAGAIAMMSLGNIFGGAMAGGFGVNHLDIAPRGAGVIMGLSNTAATIPGIIGVYVSGLILEATGSWAVVFQTAAGVYVFGLVFYLIFASSKKLFD